MTHDALEIFLRELPALGAAQAAALPVSQITFHPDFRLMCRANSCGMYGKCWMCPPDIGPETELIAHAQSFSTAVVYQTVSQLEDSFDIEGMLEAGARQNQLAQTVHRLIRAQGESRFLHLGAGGCRRCEVCAKRQEEPCRFPEEALSSLEAYCIDVSQLAESCGMRYINGPNTVTYFGVLLLDA